MVPVPSPTPVLKDSAVEEIKERPKRAPKPTISIKEQQEESKRRHDIITTTPPTEINFKSLGKNELKLWINTQTTGTDLFNKTSKESLLKKATTMQNDLKKEQFEKGMDPFTM